MTNDILEEFVKRLVLIMRFGEDTRIMPGMNRRGVSVAARVQSLVFRSRFTRLESRAAQELEGTNYTPVRGNSNIDGLFV